jgi:glycosyltransferase involved in cell wall biosynthesis
MIYAVTPYGRTGASSRVRVFEWLDRITEPRVVSSYLSHRNASPSYLARRPIAVAAAERRLRSMAAARPERLLLHREASPLSRGGIERQLLAAAEFSVYDFDDALQWDVGSGHPLRRWAPKAPKALAAVRTADRVVAGNDVLADWASEHNRDVVVIPSCVSPDAYTPKDEYALGDPPRLGWIGSANNEVYLTLIEGPLREVNRRTGARLTLIGTATSRLGELERIIDRVPWGETVQHRQLARLDLGLGPLPDAPYSRGKCGYKLLQYAAAGVPVVASPIGVNERLLRELGMPGPRDATEWTEALVELLARPAEARAELGRRARKLVQDRYSYDAWLECWKAAAGLPTGEEAT